MTSRRVTLVGTVAAVAAAVLLLGGTLRESSGAVGTPRAMSPAFTATATATLVRRLEREARKTSASTETLTNLGRAYHQQMRETGDPRYLSKAESSFRRALRAAPRSPAALAGLARLSLTRHEFRRALALGRRALSLAPEELEYEGIVGDALVELGRYREAFAAYDRLAREDPGLGSYSRIAHARLLLGDTGGAVQALSLAVDSAGAHGEPAGWARVQLGNVYLDSGRLGPAERLYREALVVDPRAAHALAGLGDIAAARRRPRGAIRLYRQALTVSAKPEFAIALGDALAGLDRRLDAEEAYGFARRLERRLARHGVNTELDQALFDLDHGRNLESALELAWTGYRQQPGLEGSHVLAWALYKHGRCSEARRYSIKALRLGTNDLDAIYHRSLIERCLGNELASAAFRARLRSLNPLYVPFSAP